MQSLLASFSELGLPMSATSKCLVNDSNLDSALKGLMKLPPESRVDDARNLGADGAMGSLIRIGIARARWDSAKTKTSRAFKLRAAGAQTGWILRGGPAASALRGSSIMGDPPSYFHQLRLGILGRLGKAPKGVPLGRRLHSF